MPKSRTKKPKKNAAAQRLVAQRWGKTTPAERSQIMRDVAKHGAGRKRSDAPRCPCGEMTLRLAKLRANKDGKSKGHKPECPFYRA